MNSLITSSISESELANRIHQIVSTLVKSGRISGNPENVSIERVNRVSILPCRRSKSSNSLNLEQLEWAAKNGKFWFEGPIKSLKINLGKGKAKEILVSELDRLSFIIVINELNYNNFIEVKNDLTKIATGLGFQVKFSQPDRNHNVTVEISAIKPISEQNVTEFLRGIEKVRRTI